jgi:hypothetical protein
VQDLQVRLLGAEPPEATLLELAILENPIGVGILRENFTPEIEGLIEPEVNLNLAQMSPQEICNHLPESLFSGLGK